MQLRVHIDTVNDTAGPQITAPGINEQLDHHLAF